MTGKVYIPADGFLRDSWALAAEVRKSGWRPDAILALWRGGAGVGVAVHEFFKVTGWDGVRHYPLKCSSYTAIGENSSGVGFTLLEETLRLVGRGERVLVVDDVLDTGKTAAAIKGRLDDAGMESRLAVVYVKPSPDPSRCCADYSVRDLGEEWIVFPHEIEGLSPAEILEKDPALAKLLEV